MTQVQIGKNAYCGPVFQPITKWSGLAMMKVEKKGLRFRALIEIDSKEKNE